MTMTKVVTDQWIDQVLAEHRALDEMEAELDAFLDSPRPDVGEEGFHRWAAALSRKLVTLHDALFRHFRFEEQSGMERDVARRHPRRLHQFRELMAEHREVLDELRGLITDALDYSEGRTPSQPNLRRRIQQLLERLRRHESEETDLIQRLEYNDIGMGD